MTPDIINGIFEIIGSVFTWMNVYRVHKDRGYAGIYVPAAAFFFSWGFWNLYFYPHLDQWFSFAGGVSLVGANLAWLGAMFKYGRKI